MLRRFYFNSLHRQAAGLCGLMGTMRRHQSTDSVRPPKDTSPIDEDMDSLDDAFAFALDELCDEISGDIGMYIPDLDFSLLGNENSKESN